MLYIGNCVVTSISQRLHHIYEQADAVTFLSKAEGFGLSLIESKHFGLPCLTFTELDAFNNIYSEEVIVVLPDREDYTVSDILIKLLTAQWEIRNTLISNFLPWPKITSKSINKYSYQYNESVQILAEVLRLRVVA